MPGSLYGNVPHLSLYLIYCTPHSAASNTHMNVNLVFGLRFYATHLLQHYCDRTSTLYLWVELLVPSNFQMRWKRGWILRHETNVNKDSIDHTSIHTTANNTMKVEELIIDGFKSYATRTVISGWDALFNAITGLNGSGKSNILDAICFVLGISSMQTVRASNLQDLIYKRVKQVLQKQVLQLCSTTLRYLNPHWIWDLCYY